MSGNLKENFFTCKSFYRPCQEYNLVVVPNDGNTTFLTTLTFALSTFGLMLSVVAVIFLLLTALLFTEWRKIYKNQVLIQFMVARFFYSTLRYFYDIAKLFDFHTSYFHPIYLDDIPLVYTEMVLVIWMCIFSKLMYDRFVKVFKVKTPSLLKVSLTAWLMPGAVSVFFFFVYSIQNDRDINFLILYLFVLKWPVLCANGVFLVLVLKNIIITNKSKTESNLRIILVMIVLIFSFCFQQVIGDVYNLVFVRFKFKYTVPYTPFMFVLINILSVYHCAISIMFWLFANKRTRILWGLSKEKPCTQNHAQLPKY